MPVSFRDISIKYNRGVLGLQSSLALRMCISCWDFRILGKIAEKMPINSQHWKEEEKENESVKIKRTGVVNTTREIRNVLHLLKYNLNKHSRDIITREERPTKITPEKRFRIPKRTEYRCMLNLVTQIFRYSSAKDTHSWAQTCYNPFWWQMAAS